MVMGKGRVVEIKIKKSAVENRNGYTSWTEVKWKLLELEMKGKNHQVVKKYSRRYTFYRFTKVVIKQNDGNKSEIMNGNTFDKLSNNASLKITVYLYTYLFYTMVCIRRYDFIRN